MLKSGIHHAPPRRCIFFTPGYHIATPRRYDTSSWHHPLNLHHTFFMGKLGDSLLKKYPGQFIYNRNRATACTQTPYIVANQYY